MKKIFLLSALFITPLVFKAQGEDDPKKMIREIISVEMVKPKEPKKTPVVVEEPKGKKGKKKPVVEEVVEEVIEDTNAVVMMPATPEELAKRANHWYNQKNKKYAKDGGSSSGKKMTCSVKVDYKPKELNPTHDVEGEIVMNVTIDFKDGKYRYTIDKIEHKAKRGVSSGGDVFADVPACGSMNLNAIMWKQLRSAALTAGKMVADDLKAFMAKPVTAESGDEW